MTDPASDIGSRTDGRGATAGAGQGGAMSAPAPRPVHKIRTTRRQRIRRAIWAALDPRAWAHAVKLVNYYNYAHVIPWRSVRKGRWVSVTPNATFANPERIELGDGVTIGARCMIWAGPSDAGRIVVGKNALFAPDVLVTAANYRYNDGQPVAAQAMDEAAVTIGRDVWIGARAIILPGARIGDGAIIAAGAVVRGEIPAMAVAAGVPAKVVSERRLPTVDE